MSYKKELFEYKLSILQKELDTINQIIERHDNFTQTTKNWTIVVWIGVTSFILKDSPTENVKQLLLLTPIIPLLFWYVDATWRRLQNRSIFRSDKISAFFNSKEFEEAYKNYDSSKIEVWDVVGRKYIEDTKYKRKTSLWRIIRFRSIAGFYLSIFCLSVIINLLTHFG